MAKNYGARQLFYSLKITSYAARISQIRGKACIYDAQNYSFKTLNFLHSKIAERCQRPKIGYEFIFSDISQIWGKCHSEEVKKNNLKQKQDSWTLLMTSSTNAM